MSYGKRVFDLRKQLNLTLEKFGEPLGVTKTAISRIEKEERTITDQMAKAICREYGVNEEWLLYGNGEMFKQPSDEIGYYVEDLLEYDGHGNPFYDMIIEMMKKYQELDEKSKTVIREYFKSVGSGLNEKRED
jgi:transcriptional regulator with XRE-family HTH domain|nr:MAG TPA: helix-turn-helix domain protein [Caudoviricetes sp.]